MKFPINTPALHTFHRHLFLSLAMSDTSHAVYLLSIPSVRERASKVFDKATAAGASTNFLVDLAKVPAVVDFVVGLIARDYGTDYAAIPPHGRWQHFNVGGVDRVSSLVAAWQAASVDNVEVTKRLLDLFVVSVLLDAGAGNKWTYKTNGATYNRSEGIAVASLNMFVDGAFSTDSGVPFQVNGKALEALPAEALAQGMQATNYGDYTESANTNPMDGLAGRAALMQRLGAALTANATYFGADARPGNILDYLLGHPTTTVDGDSRRPVIQLTTLWDALMEGLAPIWPSGRTQLAGLSLGDAWPCSSLASDEFWLTVAPFHKLTQWLCYSLLVPIKKYSGATFVGEELQTGLPEYRNGGLLVDFGVLALKPEILAQGLATAREKNAAAYGKPYELPMYTPDSDVIVEWRALTVGFLDHLLPLVNEKLNTTLSLAQLLEAGTWKAGREIAAEKRPVTKGPPIDLLSDGTVF